MKLLIKYIKRGKLRLYKYYLQASELTVNEILEIVDFFERFHNCKVLNIFRNNQVIYDA